MSPTGVKSQNPHEPKQPHEPPAHKPEPEKEHPEKKKEEPEHEHTHTSSGINWTSINNHPGKFVIVDKITYK